MNESDISAKDPQHQSWRSATEVSCLALPDAAPAIRLERWTPVGKDAAPRLDRVAMDNWQQAAFDQLLIASGALSSIDIELRRGQAPRVRSASAEQPACPADSSWQLSASHTGAGRAGLRRRGSNDDAWLVVAAQQGEREKLRIGVDLEQRQHRSAQSMVAMESLLGWSVGSEDGDEFYRRWTAAEAIYKTGLLPIASTKDWLRAVAPLASAVPVSGQSVGSFSVAGWIVGLWWCEPTAGLTLCLVSASVSDHHNEQTEMYL